MSDIWEAIPTKPGIWLERGYDNHAIQREIEIISTTRRVVGGIPGIGTYACETLEQWEEPILAVKTEGGGLFEVHEWNNLGIFAYCYYAEYKYLKPKEE